MEFRNEWKTIISRADVMTIDHRLSAVTMQDFHASSGYYVVHCLYFGDIYDNMPEINKAGSGKNSSVFRIRYYDDNLSYIKLEKKYESNGTSVIEDCEVTKEFVEVILNGNFSEIVRDPMGRTGDELDPLIQEFYWNVIGKGMRPAVSVSYYRKPYLYSYGKVRVTIDYNFRSDRDVSGFLDPISYEDTESDNRYYLKVKWGNYLPEVIKSAVTLSNRRNPAYYLYDSVRLKDLIQM